MSTQETGMHEPRYQFPPAPGVEERRRQQMKNDANAIPKRTEEPPAREPAKEPKRMQGSRRWVGTSLGVRGMTAEVEFTPSAKPSKENKATKKEQELTKEERELKRVSEHLAATTQTLKGLSWFERTFKAKELHERIQGLREQEQGLAQAVARAKIGKTLEQEKRPTKAPSIPESAVESIENAWQLYQAELANLQSLHDQLAKLSPWPWKDREEKALFRTRIAGQEQTVAHAKARHLKEGMARSNELNKEQKGK